jgi:uncharacterized protein DUF3786
MIDATWWERLAAAEPAEVSANAAVDWDETHRTYRVRMAGAWYSVVPDARQVANCDDPDAATGLPEHLALVLYLVGAKRIEPAGRWVKPESLPSGAFFFRGPHVMPTGKLAHAFCDDPSRLVRAAAALDGQPLGMADAAVIIAALPRVPMALAVWGADDEFGAEASVLVDPTASEHLSLDAIWALGGHVIKRLCGPTPD